MRQVFWLQAQLAAELVPRFWAAVSAAGSDEPAADLDTVLASSLAVRCSMQHCPVLA